DAALAELEERFIAGEGAADEYEIRRVGDMVRAERRNDTDAWAALFLPGSAPSTVVLDPDRVPGMLTMRNGAALMSFDGPGRRTSRVTQLPGALFSAFDQFDDLSAARTRFEALSADVRRPLVDSRLIRVTGRADWLNRFEPGFEGRTIYHPDCVLIDHRP